jgi:hypothetical protein
MEQALEWKGGGVGGGGEGGKGGEAFALQDRIGLGEGWSKVDTAGCVKKYLQCKQAREKRERGTVMQLHTPF